MSKNSLKAQLKKRLELILPSISQYEKMPMVNNVPFAMNAGAFNYRSENINTDSDGFRFTKYKDGYILPNDIEKFEEVNIIIGNSTLFGVGVSNDDNTIASKLSKISKEPWLNISIRGAVSLTEYIHAIRYIYKAKKVKNIIIFSGIVDIYLNLLVDKPTKFEKRIEPERWIYSCPKRIISRFFAKRYKLRQLDIIDKSFMELLFYPFNKKNFVKKETLTLNQQIDDCIENIKKIFFLYSALEKQLDTNVIYMLQPFYYWTNKKKSKMEIEIFKLLEEIDKGTFWDRTRKELDENIYKEIIKKLKKEAKNFDIKFVDTNSLYNTEETIFSDSVHFTDTGSEFTAKLILNTINQGS